MLTRIVGFLKYCPGEEKILKEQISLGSAAPILKDMDCFHEDVLGLRAHLMESGNHCFGLEVAVRKVSSVRE